MKTNLSVCIPTYNRAVHLKNCLNSIKQLNLDENIKLEVCISDNCSTDNTYEIVKEAQQYIEIKYQRNDSNLGIPRNFLKVISMASGDFCWLIGDDDLLVSDTLVELSKLFKLNPKIDFFYINSFHLTTEYILDFPQPFETYYLPEKMEKFSAYNMEGPLKFIDLIDPKVSFDFLGGMFLSVFRRSLWMENARFLSESAIMDMRTFSHFDNTFPHVKIFAHAFSRSYAFFKPEPLSVSLSGARDWSPMFPFIRSVRFIEALDIYRKNGLSIFQYLHCRNFALRYFIPDMIYMIVHSEKSGIKYLSFFKHVLPNVIFPNFYLSLVYYFGRKANLIIGKYLNTK